MSRPAQLAVAGLSLFLSLAIVTVLVLEMSGGLLGGEPVGSPAATASVAVSSSPAPSAEGSEDPLALFTRIEADVRAIRGLPAVDLGTPEVLSTSELEAELARIFEEEYPEEERAVDNAVFRALGLLGADDDIGLLLERLYAGQVIGFYDTDRKRMVVVTDAGLDAQAQITYAHEYTHALQDAAFDIGAAHDALVGNDDATLARIGLEEGDASVVMVLWGLANLTADELLGVSQTPLPDMSGIPEWMVQQLQLPYLAGAEFVSALYLGGLFAAVDRAYDDPPATTEQLLHVDKYEAREAPTDVEPIELASGLAGATGGEWEAIESSTMGEAMLGIWLGGIGAATEAASAAAAGWGGDALTVATGPDDGWALALRIEWDAAAEADEFVAAYRAVVDGLPFPAEITRIGDRETLVLQASSGELLDAAADVSVR